MYRCALDGHNPSAAAEAGAQLLCVKELASRVGHKSCSIDRVRTVPCEGELVLVHRPAGGAVSVTAPAGGTIAAPAEATETAAVPAPIPGLAAPPDTVEQFAKQAAEQSTKDWEKTKATLKEGSQDAGKNLEKAGTAVGTAAKKSWDCVASLFARC